MADVSRRHRSKAVGANWVSDARIRVFDSPLARAVLPPRTSAWPSAVSAYWLPSFVAAMHADKRAPSSFCVTQLRTASSSASRATPVQQQRFGPRIEGVRFGRQGF